jgi:acyl-CoA thioesterase
MAHPFDELIVLTAPPADGTAGAVTAPTGAPDAATAPRTVLAHTHPAWANMVGPFGGATAAQALAALTSDPRAQGRPAALTLNFTTAIADGEMRITVEPVRTNRSNQHWVIRVEQESGVVLTGTALFASDRETFSDTEAVLPAEAGSPEEHPVSGRLSLPWLENYEFRFVKGAPEADPHAPSPSPDSESLVWFRPVQEREWDYPALAAAADVFFPRIFLRTGQPSPAGTISFTVYFHTDPQELAGQGRQLLGRARASRLHNGLFDQVAHVWGESGDLLATTTQLVYFKTK